MDSTSIRPDLANGRIASKLLATVLLVLAGWWGPLLSGNAYAAYDWIEGPIQESRALDCQFNEIPGLDSWVAYYADPAAQKPAVGDVYYVAVVVSEVGLPCIGPLVLIELQLPPDTVPAIDNAHPVKCFLNGNQASCPQRLEPVSVSQTFIYPSTDPTGAWPAPYGAVQEFLFPVRSSSQLGAAPFTAIVHVADGYLSPDLRPQVPVSVFSALNTPPGVLSIARGSASPTSASTLSWTITFSTSVSGVDASDFKLVQTGVIGSSITSVTPVGPATTYTVTATRGSGSGTVGLDLVDDDSIKDSSGAALGGTGLHNGDATGESYTVTAPASAGPTVLSISRTGPASIGPRFVTWTVTFSEPVNGVDASDFKLVTSGPSRAAIAGVSPSSGPAASYTVTAAAGNQNVSVRLDLADDDSIVNASGSPLGGPGRNNGDKAGDAYAIVPAGMIFPRVSSIVRTGAATTNASAVSWTVTFSQPVMGVDASDFRLVASGVSGASLTTVSPSSGVETRFTVTATSGAGNGTLRLDLVDDDSIVNGGGASLSGTGSANADTMGEAYTLQRDTVATAGVDMNQHGLTGAWFEPATNGQGFLIEVFPDLLAPGKGLIAGSWFTFDAPPAGNASKQRWYTFSGPVLTGQRNVELTLYRNTGGNFDAGPVTTGVPIGRVVLDFTDCTNGSVTYSFDDGSYSGSIPIQRITPNVTCSTTAARPTNPDFGISGNWFEPVTSGQGFVIEVNPQASAVFFAWYTYAPDGVAQGASGQRWYTGLGDFAPGARTVNVTLHETRGGVFDAVPPVPVSSPVGTATLTFTACNSARLSYTFTSGSSAGHARTIELVRVGSVPAGCGH